MNFQINFETFTKESKLIKFDKFDKFTFAQHSITQREVKASLI